MYYLQSRYYNPEIGRFINADGLLENSNEILGNNLYAYCGNNTINNHDPDGYFLLNLSMLIVGKVIVVVIIPVLVIYAVAGVSQVVDGIMQNISFSTRKKSKDVRVDMKGVKKQGLEMKNKSRMNKEWESRSGNRRPKLPKKHTPSRKTGNT